MNIERNVPEHVLLGGSFFRENSVFATMRKIEHGVVRQQKREEDQRHPKEGSWEEGYDLSLNHIRMYRPDRMAGSAI